MGTHHTDDQNVIAGLRHLEMKEPSSWCFRFALVVVFLVIAG